MKGSRSPLRAEMFVANGKPIGLLQLRVEDLHGWIGARSESSLRVASYSFSLRLFLWLINVLSALVMSCITVSGLGAMLLMNSRDLPPSGGGEPLEPHDLLYFDDDAGNPCHVTAAFWLSSTIGHHAIEQRLRKWGASDKRLQSLVEIRSGRLHWVPHDGVETKIHIDQHVRTEEEAYQLISDYHSDPLCRQRPLWSAKILDVAETQQTVVIAKVHHAISDGVALAQNVAQHLFDADSNAPANIDSNPTIKISETSLERLYFTYHLLRSAWYGLSYSLFWLTRSRPRAPAEFKVPRERPSGRKKCFKPLHLNLDSVRTLQTNLRELGLKSITINDIFVYLIAHAVDRTYSMFGNYRRHKYIQMLLPMTARIAPPNKLNNRSSFCFVRFRRRRGSRRDKDALISHLKAVQEEILYMKRITSRAIIFAFVEVIMAVLPQQVAKLVTSEFMSKAEVCFAHVYGPPTKSRLMGSVIDRIDCWEPVRDEVGLAVQLLRYGGDLALSLVTDATQVEHVPDIAHVFYSHLQEEFDRMIDLVVRNE